MIFLFSLLFIFAGGTVLAGYYVYLLKNLPSPDKIIERRVEQSTKIYDREGKTLLYELHGDENRTTVDLKDISQYVIWATLSAEDRDFYNHHGFSVKGIMRSFLSNIFTGTKVGGSSITQQFVKNAVLTGEKTYTRKIKELIISYQIENKFTKDQILKMYFNEIPYGSVTYGIESASRRFFGKDAKDLTIAESAFLAAIPNAPTYYSPFGPNRDALEKRYKYIIDVMVEQKYITKEEADAAKAENVFSKLQNNKIGIVAPHFVFYVKDVLSGILGETELEQGGYKVITSLDLKKQENAEKAVADNVKKINDHGASNAALVSLNPKNGEVLAMVGSVDYFNKDIDGNVNVVLRPRQPGSSFKPIAYTAGFIKGYTPNTVLYDVETTFPTQIEKGGYTPKDYDGKERGPVSVRQALAGSLNIPAVKILYLTGINNVLDLADNMGYTTLKDRSRFGLSLVLGGGEVKLLEHAAAYATFVNDGERITTSPILRIEDAKGKTVYEYKPEKKRVMDMEIARQTTDILSDNSAREYIFGANNLLYLGYPSAAKTGTTNDFHDAWTLGFTPELVTGVWVGNNDNKAMKEKSDGSIVAAPIWNQYMKASAKDKTLEFKKPKPVITGKPVLDGDTVSGATIKIDKASGKLATDFTPVSFIIEKQYKEVHSILYYVNKDDPQGPVPTDPSQDPFYNAFEDGVRKWAEKQNFVSELPPTGYDDLHIPANKPEISILSPQSNDSLPRIFSVSVRASAPRGISRIEYFIDETLVATAKGSYGVQISLPANIGSGFHTLKAAAYDDIDNGNSHEININVTNASAQGDMVWLSPKNNSVIDSFPTNISFNIQDASSVALWYTKTGENNYYKIGEAANPNGYNSITWTEAPSVGGNYEIKAVIKKQLVVKEDVISVVVQ